MKAEPLHIRPNYKLLKQSDTVSLFHFQMPRFLMEDSRYSQLSIEAKMVYMLIFNRFQLSKLHGWANPEGEVFVIYTRRELADYLNIGEKRITAAMQDLMALGLLWERRCGRGHANQIYLAAVQPEPANRGQPSGGPLEPAPDATRPAEMAGLGFPESYGESASVLSQDPPNVRVKNGQDGGFSPAISAALEPSNRPPSYIDLKEKERESVMSGQSIALDGQDGLFLEEVLERAELDALPPDDAAVIADAIERLFFSESIKVGSAVYPRERIRHHLGRIDFNVIQAAHGKITSNTSSTVKNSSAYVVTVLFNSIMEHASDLMVDSYLNQLRNRPSPQAAKSDSS